MAETPPSLASPVFAHEILQQFMRLEQYRPQVRPFLYAEIAIGPNAEDLDPYVDQLIAFLRSGWAVGPKGFRYLERLAKVVDHYSAKATELHKAIAFGRLANTHKPPPLDPQLPPTGTLPWRVLPAGKWGFAEIQAHFRRLSRERRDLPWDLKRLTFAEHLKPSERWVGMDDFEGYLVYVFAKKNAALLDRPLYGNACYVLKGNWKALSRLTKFELLTGRKKFVRRIIHRGAWRKRACIALGVRFTLARKRKPRRGGTRIKARRSRKR